MLGNGARVESGGAEVVEDDGGRAPKGDKGQHRRGRHENFGDRANGALRGAMIPWD